MTIIHLKNGETYTVRSIVSKIRNNGSMVKVIDLEGRERALLPGFAISHIETVA